MSDGSRRRGRKKRFSPDYIKYLSSPEWRMRRAQAIERAGGKCERCPCADHLHVHHLSYKNLFNEPPEDLEVLCRKCHAKEHPHMKRQCEVRPRRKRKPRYRSEEHRQQRLAERRIASESRGKPKRWISVRDRLTGEWRKEDPALTHQEAALKAIAMLAEHPLETFIAA